MLLILEVRYVLKLPGEKLPFVDSFLGRLSSGTASWDGFLGRLSGTASWDGFLGRLSGTAFWDGIIMT